ncbi:metallopeptidase family protein [Luteococcus sp.]|uniref:metallopeptidase family protein n=1 Tax=Luteococcus sp. TaxID=1969402 RepID=UPI003734DC62
MVEMGPDEFEELAAEALEEIPDQLMELVDNCLLIIEDANEQDPTILGLYEGIPLTERGHSCSAVLPDRIFIYRLPTLRMCQTREQVADEVLTTVVHEVAHFFGIEDGRLHELGWG